MATSDLVTLGRRIAAARSRSGLTQAELAGASSLDRSALAKVENGTRRISALELARVAEAVGERIEWFVTEPPPSIVSHRDLRDAGTVGTTIDRTVERIARNVEFALQHDDRWHLPTPPPMPRPATVGEAERAAAHTRAALGLDGTEPLLDAARHAATFGLLAFCLDMGPDCADAACVLLGHGGVTVANGHLRVGRRRLALAHELGHYLFADEYTVDWRVAERHDDLAWENRLDRFARALLLPPSGIDDMWSRLRREHGELRSAAVRTGSAFRVDMATLAQRLRELGHVDHDEAEQIRTVRTTRSDIVSFDLVVGHELDPPSLPRVYEQSVLRLYRSETVSAARAIDLLLDTWDEEDLPPLPPLDEAAIWTFVS